MECDKKIRFRVKRVDVDWNRVHRWRCHLVTVTRVQDKDMLGFWLIVPVENDADLNELIARDFR